MSRIARRGASLIAIALLLFAVPVGVGSAWLALRAPAHAAASNTDLRVALLRSGLGAEALTAAGLSAQEAASAVDAFATAMAQSPSALSQADATYASARVAKDALERKVRSGLATQQEVADLAAAKTALASAESARSAVLDGWFEAATANLSNAKVALLTTIHGNEDWSLPVEFLVKQRDEVEWVAIRKALNNERICAKYEDPPNQNMQTALSTWRADATVAAAKSACDTNLTAVQSAWNSATTE